MSNRIPSRIKIDNSKFHLFQEIKQKFPKACYNSDVFALAVAYGYDAGLKVPIESKRDYINAVSISDELNSVMLLIALADFGDEVNQLINNPSLMFELAEEYANGGIDLFYDDFRNCGGDFANHLAEKLIYLNDEFDFKKQLNEVL